MEIIAAAVNFPGLAPVGLTGLAAGIGIAAALLNCFFGYRLMKVWISIIGFLIGFIGGYSLFFYLLPGRTGVCILAAIVAGLLVGFAAYKVYLLGVFLLCGGMTMASVYLFMAGTWSGLENWIFLLVSLLAGALVGVLAVMFTKPVIILSTGISGGFTAGAMIFQVLGIVNPAARWGVCAVIAVGGVAVQFLTSKKRRR